jgi:hypothetical protein
MTITTEIRRSKDIKTSKVKFRTFSYPYIVSSEISSHKMAAKNEHPKKYGWWLNELSLSQNRYKRNNR